MEKIPRRYRQTARAEQAAATAERILDAAIAQLWTRSFHAVSLADVAHDAGVTVQTIIRRFGGRDGVITAAVARETARVEAERDARVGDVPDIVRAIVRHYERVGVQVLRLLVEAERVEGLATIAEQGREVHRAWCRRLFADTLDALPRGERPRRLAQFIAICDVYTWKLLRLDAALSRSQVERALIEMLTPLVTTAET